MGTISKPFLLPKLQEMDATVKPWRVALCCNPKNA